MRFLIVFSFLNQNSKLKMKYYSLNRNAPIVSFEEAVVKGLAPDKGLYFPDNITPLPSSFFQNIENLSNEEIAFEAIKQFVGNDIPEKNLTGDESGSGKCAAPD